MIFASTRAFLQALERIRKADIPHQVRTVPDYLHPECGMCLYIPAAYRSQSEEKIGQQPDTLFID
ncbi:hypothetical protein PORCRE_745 [Porphyromonas crevioricanis JCM 15906]|uniref:Putative Se/S carrier protein-like domain-containing protein n=1 Tax=Porphyromonas crevioricanis JCM 15906 TaxID=1305617 RepID=T1CMR4_9PORP|nr:hypothetical protein PORCRE_745 [Porphyromonas crevioricanis JCM 15906]